VLRNKLFLFDLLERYKSQWDKNVLPIKLLSNTVPRSIESMSFVDDNIFIARANYDGSLLVIQIKLDAGWANAKMFATQRFSKRSVEKRDHLWKKICAFFYEHKVSVLYWIVGSLMVYCCLAGVKKELRFMLTALLGPIAIPFFWRFVV
jgi:hypothetical protein